MAVGIEHLQLAAAVAVVAIEMALIALAPGLDFDKNNEEE